MRENQFKKHPILIPIFALLFALSICLIFSRQIYYYFFPAANPISGAEAHVPSKIEREGSKIGSSTGGNNGEHQVYVYQKGSTVEVQTYSNSTFDKPNTYEFESSATLEPGDISIQWVHPEFNGKFELTDDPTRQLVALIVISHDGQELFQKQESFIENGEVSLNSFLHFSLG